MKSQNWILIGLAVYFVASLTAMAPMSIGAAVCAAAIGIGFGGFGPLFARVREEWQNQNSRTFFLASFWLALACVLSVLGALFAPLKYGSNFVPASFFRDTGKLWYLAWPLLLVPAMRAIPEEKLWRVVRAWIVAFAILSAIGIAQFFTGWPRPQQIPNTRFFHATVFLGHHLSLASIFIFPYFAALDGLRGRENAAKLALPRWFLALTVVLGTVTLFMTASRTLWVALPVGVLVWILWNLPRKAALGLGTAIVLFVAGASQLAAVQERIGFGGVHQRAELWKANWEFFKARPVFGVGWRLNQGLSGIYFEHIRPGQEYFQGHAHNNFIEMLAGTGAFGTAAWLAWSVLVLWIVWLAARGPRAVGLSRGLLCAWIVFHLNGLTQVNFWEGKVTHQMMLMASLALVWATQAKKGEA